MRVLARLLSLVDVLSRGLAVVAMVLVMVLMGAMIYEVVSRRFFNAPTLWAFDISYMTNGAIFLLGGGATTLLDRNVRIDFLAQLIPERVRLGIWTAVELFLVLPAFFLLAEAAIAEAWRAYETGQVERVSPWAPLVWPYFTAIAVGLVALTLQILASAIRQAEIVLAGPDGRRLAP